MIRLLGYVSDVLRIAININVLIVYFILCYLQIYLSPGTSKSAHPRHGAFKRREEVSLWRNPNVEVPP